MPGKLINTLKYGSSRTKRKIYMMFGILAAGAALIVAALMLSNELLGLAAFLVLFIDGLILFNTSFEQKEVSVKKKEEAEDEEPGALEWISSEKKKKNAVSEEEEAEKAEDGKEEKKDEKKGKTIGELQEEEENPLLQYDEKKLKKIMVAYKVKKHHVTVMVDSCQTERIIQSPAYMWKDSSYLYFLVLEKEPRLIKSPLGDSSAIHIRRGVAARPLEEYSDMNEPSMVSMVFGGLLPKYYKVESNAYRTDYRKNLYSAAPGIWCTSASVKNMTKLLPDNFILDDNSKIANESDYYQEIYIARLMCWDGIYSGQEYKDKVLSVLGGLVKSQLSDGTVWEYLNQMMMKGLIPKEYVEFALSKRKIK